MSDTRVSAGVRIPPELKKKLQEVADHEDRTLSKMCEILLTWGLKQLNEAGDTLKLTHSSSGAKPSGTASTLRRG